MAALVAVLPCPVCGATRQIAEHEGLAFLWCPRCETWWPHEASDEERAWAEALLLEDVERYGRG